MRFGKQCEKSLPDMEITGLTDDSRKVQPGMLFACIRGERFDGGERRAGTWCGSGAG
ncbi:MAG: Mur ligase domain-containing protein [Ruminococcus sp.]